MPAGGVNIETENVPIRANTVTIQFEQSAEEEAKEANPLEGLSAASAQEETVDWNMIPSGFIGNAARLAQRVGKMAMESRISGPGVSGAAGYNYMKEYSTWQVRKLQVDAVTAEAIDTYFSLYGYNKAKVCNIDLKNKRRPVFDYYRIPNLQLKKNVMPSEYALELKAIFAKGVRIWYDPTKIGDFSRATLNANKV